MNQLRIIVGRVLREAREEAGLTLRQTEERVGSRFKASSVAFYERGERSPSLERFFELAGVYGIPPDRLLAQVCADLTPEGRQEIVVDLAALPKDDSKEARVVATFAHQIKSQRQDFMSDVLTLRSGDVEVMAMRAGSKPKDLLGGLRRVLRPR